MCWRSASAGGGLPYGSITLFDSLSAGSVDVIEHVITHELGHTIGFRHSDYYNRAISYGSGGNEGDAGVGAVRQLTGRRERRAASSRSVSDEIRTRCPAPGHFRPAPTAFSRRWPGTRLA